MPKDLSNNSYYQALKSFQKSRFQDLPVVSSVTEAAVQVALNEVRILKAFHLFNEHIFHIDFFCKDYLDSCVSSIKYRVRDVKMKKEFSDLLLLIDEQAALKELTFLYYLYCYWAVDLLNQIADYES